jgi:ketosteroid isomerase-like protein
MDVQQLDRTDDAAIGVADVPSQEETVEQLFEAFSRRELEDVLELLDPEIVFQPITAEVARAGEPYRGYEGMRRYMADAESIWEELTVHPARIRAAGDAVVAVGLTSARARDGGSFEDVPTTWMFKFHRGLVVQIQIFSDPTYAREALAG